MNRIFSKNFLCLVCLLYVCISHAQPGSAADLEKNFKSPPASAKPWIFWYWMHGAISKEGITADLEAMKEVGIGGAYLMPIKDTVPTIPFQPTVRQLTPEWWEMVRFSLQEAKRLGLKIGMHVSDGFALAGGPWITPGLSMQKLTWSKTFVKAGETGKIKLAEPATKEGYYKDVAVFAYPVRGSNSQGSIPQVTTSNGVNAGFLAVRGEKGSFRSDTACWIQYQYPQPFTCRAVSVHVGGNNYQAQRLILQASDDGINFKIIIRLTPPRHGWQDTDEDYTYAVPAVTARYFRFVYDKDGSEPGAEDLDAAKWKPFFKVNGIYLSDEAVINQFEAKNGSIWRVAANTTSKEVTADEAIPLKNIINLSGKLDKEGNLDWPASRSLPAGKLGWMIVRIGHTSTGHTNYTGGGGLGLECDKFNPAAVKRQFDNWFARAFDKTDPVLSKKVLKVLHIDSWECGSQNWSPVFAAEFRKRRGYDLTPYLLAMTGVPVQDAETSEKFLHDVRQTIAELVNDVFYVTLKKLAYQKGSTISAESVAPTMISDGLLHYKHADIPMGEFWLNSPTHDKPNDMLDAISGAHIYGKNIVQAEAFTSVRMNWGEHPGNLKTVGDRNFALGINKMVMHVFTHNPWMNRKPGMTLDGVGLYFQRDQTWFKQSKAWIDYLARCQALLQMGKPVVDIAVFTGEELPRRAVLPDRLVNTLPGIFGKEKVESEKRRLENKGQPLRQIPDGVSHSANMADPEGWIDPLNGYAYDSFNPDALMTMTVKNGRVVTAGGASYKILVFPGRHPMNPNSTLMSLAVINKLLQLVKDGAIVIMGNDYNEGIGLKDMNGEVRRVWKELVRNDGKKGKVLFAPYRDSAFDKWGLPKDVEIMDNDHSIAWYHRKTNSGDIYFISNQENAAKRLELSLRLTGKMPELWDAVTGEMREPSQWKLENGRTSLSFELANNQSLFIIFRKPAKEHIKPLFGKSVSLNKRDLSRSWTIQFDKRFGGPLQPVVLENLKSWTQFDDTAVKYYSGTAFYQNTFTWLKEDEGKTARIELYDICNIATIRVNGINCGTLWTKPFSLDITKALKTGVNEITIEVANTWHNRLIGDQALSAGERVTWTTAPFRLKDKPLLPAGLIERITLLVY